jgi:hypothetical protein
MIKGKFAIIIIIFYYIYIYLLYLFDRPDKKMRAPAWCDRILWYSNGDQVGTVNSVRQLGYRKCDALLSSDHKAVSGVR